MEKVFFSLFQDFVQNRSNFKSTTTRKSRLELTHLSFYQKKKKNSDTSGFGYQMMLKMGWKEGCGLGKNLQGFFFITLFFFFGGVFFSDFFFLKKGPVSGIKTSKQFDRTGLGTELSNTRF